MERIDCGDEMVEFLFAGWSSADAVIDEAFVKIRFWSVVVREKFIFNKTYEKVGVARSHFSSHALQRRWFARSGCRQMKSS